MVVFGYILLIIFEIIFTVYFVKILIQLENKVNIFHAKMLEIATATLQTNDKIKNVLTKFNKIVRIITNKKFHQIKRIVLMTSDIIQTILLIKSLNLSKGLKSINLNLLKKVTFARIGQQIIKKFLNFLQNLCTI